MSVNFVLKGRECSLNRQHSSIYDDTSPWRRWQTLKHSEIKHWVLRSWKYRHHLECWSLIPTKKKQNIAKKKEKNVRFQKGPILEWAVFYTKPDILSPYGYLDIQI
jgi:ribosomal protein S21